MTATVLSHLHVGTWFRIRNRFSLPTERWWCPQQRL